MPFYIGKGTGARAYDHITRPDGSRKGRRIRAVVDSGRKVLVSRLVEDLSEEQAIRLEAELISAYGTEDTERWTPSFGQVFVTAKVESGS